MTDKFYQFTPDHLKLIIDFKLSATDIKLFLYLSLIDPFGVRPIKLPDTKTILKQLNICKSSYYTSKAKLQNKNLWDFTENETYARNLTITRVQKNGKQSRKLENSPENWNQVQKIGKQSKKLENEALDLLPDNDSNISKNIKNIQTHSDHSEAIEERNTKELINNIENGTQGKENQSPIDDAKFIEYCQQKYPNVESITAYLKSPDKATGKPVYEKLYARYQGKSESEISQSECDRYWQEKYSYENMKWSEELPCYTQWLNRVKNLKNDATFIEDNSLGYSRNLRITFIRWYQNYYQIQAEENSEVNPNAKELIDRFLKSW